MNIIMNIKKKSATAILKSYYRYPIKCSETVTVVFLILILFLCHSAGMHKVNYVEVPFLITVVPSSRRTLVQQHEKQRVLPLSLAMLQLSLL